MTDNNLLKISVLSSNRTAITPAAGGLYLADTKLQPVNNTSFDSVDNFTGAYSTVTFKGNKGLIDTDGRFVFGPVFKTFKVLTDSTFLVESNKQFAVLDLAGNEIINFQDDTLSDNGYGILIEKHKGKQGAISLSGCRLLPATFDWISNYYKGRIAAYNVSGFTFANDTGYCNYLNPAKPIHLIGGFSEGLCAVKTETGFGFMDAAGNIRIACRYKKVYPFSEGKACVELNGFEACIDKNEKLVLQPLYTYIGHYCGGFCIVKSKTGLFGLADHTGYLAVSARFDSMAPALQGGYLTFKSGKTGYISETGQEVFDPKFNGMALANNRYAVVHRNGKYGVYSLSGQVHLPVMYNSITVNPFNNGFLLLR